jgi:hypothetical protein
VQAHQKTDRLHDALEAWNRDLHTPDGVGNLRKRRISVWAPLDTGPPTPGATLRASAYCRPRRSQRTGTSRSAGAARDARFRGGRRRNGRRRERFRNGWRGRASRRSALGRRAWTSSRAGTPSCAISTRVQVESRGLRLPSGFDGCARGGVSSVSARRQPGLVGEEAVDRVVLVVLESL